MCKISLNSNPGIRNDMTFEELEKEIKCKSLLEVNPNPYYIKVKGEIIELTMENVLIRFWYTGKKITYVEIETDEESITLEIDTFKKMMLASISFFYYEEGK